MHCFHCGHRLLDRDTVSILYTVQQHAAAHRMGDVFLTNGCISAQVHAQAASGPVNGTGRVAMTR